MADPIRDVRWARAVEALCDGASEAEAARIAGVDVSTVRAWRATPQVRARIARAADESVEKARAMLAAAVPEAIAVLKQAAAQGSLGSRRALCAREILDRTGVAVPPVAARRRRGLD